MKIDNVFLRMLICFGVSQEILCCVMYRSRKTNMIVLSVNLYSNKHHLENNRKICVYIHQESVLHHVRNNIIVRHVLFL